MGTTRFGLPNDYVHREEVIYFDDAPYLASDIIHQPEVYEVASYLLATSGRSCVIDFGCGSGRKLRAVDAERHIGVDHGTNIHACRHNHPGWGEWVEADFSDPTCVGMAELASSECVVVCADVVEHLLDPSHLLRLLAECYRRGAIVLTSTPDRIRVRGADHRGPPPNESHIREWSLSEYGELLASFELPSVFAGYTINNNRDRLPRTIVTLHDPEVTAAIAAREARPSEPPPVAVLAAYNEEDVITEAVEDLIAQGCDVIVIDNWSTDGTWAKVEALVAAHPDRVTSERFPASGPISTYEWQDILRRKATIGAVFPGRWILHVDADELRRSPLPGTKLAEGLAVAKALGCTRVNFNVMNFRPIDGRPFPPDTMGNHFDHFEFGNRTGHFAQNKAWLQPSSEPVDLATTGGHVADFESAQDFRYKFLVQHYPIRSIEHGRKKVLLERQPRWSGRERSELGWHTQYDQFSAGSNFAFDTESLIRKDADFWPDHGLEIMTDLLERRLKLKAG